MNYSDIQHRFANKQAGRNGRISAGNVRYEGKNYYSYNTVFGQWVDVEKNVCIVFEGSTSSSSSKHKLYKGHFPDDVHVFPYNDNRGGWYSYDGCDLMGWEREFTFRHRCILIGYYVTKIYNSLAAIKDGKKKGLEKVDFTPWDYVEELCSLYKDTSINKYLKSKYGKADSNSEEIKKYKRKLVKLLKAGERNVETLTDALFGEGTYKTYWDYCARYRKSADKRAKVEALCERLGIASPYESYSRGRMETGMSAEEIRNLDAKERNVMHFMALAYKEDKKHEGERKKKYNKNFRNAYKWIVGVEPKQSSWGGGYEDDVHNNCINKDNGVVYECSGNYIFRFYWCNTKVSFNYDDFRKSEDKEAWIANFYAKCKEAADNRKAIGILTRIKAHYEVVGYSEMKFVAYDYLRENTTDAEYAICAEFIRKQDKYFADKEARRRAEEIARLKREEDERKEKEYLAQVKQEQIDECLSRGIEGKRDLWRKHLQGLYDIYNKDDEFYMGGNVLLRFNLGKDTIETSKNIRIPVAVCKKMWGVVSKWHENPSCFKPMEIDTKGSGRYKISSYQNDILTAGCHKIAFCEMERMYNEIINA